MIDLHLGDCMDAVSGLPSFGRDAVGCTVSDPPFDQRTHAKALEAGIVEGDRVVGAALPFAPLGGAELAAVASEIVRVTRRWIVVFSAERHIETWAVGIERAGGRFVRLGIVERTNPRPQMSGDRPAPAADFLVIAHARPVRMRWNGGGKAARWKMGAARFDGAGPTVHPAQKHLGTMSQLVDDFTEQGELVLDPFAGSGTTALACVRTGRAFVGYERDAGYHEAAMRRLDGAREQLSMADLLRVDGLDRPR